MKFGDDVRRLDGGEEGSLSVFSAESASLSQDEAYICEGVMVRVLGRILCLLHTTFIR